MKQAGCLRDISEVQKAVAAAAGTVKSSICHLLLCVRFQVDMLLLCCRIKFATSLAELSQKAHP